MIQEEHSRSLNEHSTHSTETPRQRSGLARMSAQYKLWASRSMEAQPTNGPSRFLILGQPDRLTQITRATDELGRCTDELKKPLCLSDRWGAFLGQADWLAELHNLLYEEQS
jgi:hypothetical protein